MKLFLSIEEYTLIKSGQTGNIIGDTVIMTYLQELASNPEHKVLITDDEKPVSLVSYNKNEGKFSETPIV